MSTAAAGQQPGSRFHQFYQLTKPRVVSLIVFCAIIGMLLAVQGMAPLVPFLAGTVGIAFVAGAAAAMNCLVEPLKLLIVGVKIGVKMAFVG